MSSISNKTYPLGSSEAMKREPRLDEEYYLQAVVIVLTAG